MEIEAMSDKPNTVVGVDYRELGERYEDVLGTVLRADPNLVVICNPTPQDSDFKMVQTAYLSGHNVLLVQARHLAPASTNWLQHPIA